MLLTLCIGSPAIAAVPSNVEVTGTRVDGDQVTTRIYVADDQNLPVPDLLDTDFQLFVDEQALDFDSRNWKRPGQALLPPSFIIVLLDMSGSMKNPDSRGTTKVEGALTAIRQFRDAVIQRTENFPEENIPKIAIVPFGEPGPGCSGYRVEDNQLDRFFTANDFLLENQLLFLESQTPCASTNLYEPISKSLQFFGDTSREQFYPNEGDESRDAPRLSMIVLSDGYHTEGNEAEDFELLAADIRQNPGVIIHTLGYGLTPAELGNRYGLGRAATRDDINAGRIDEKDFVDKDRLAQIAQLAGGISKFSGDAVAVSDKLQIFLSSILGEYEITYTQPNADRASEHTVQAVVLTEPDPLRSDIATYKIRAHGAQPLPKAARVGLFASTLLILGMFGVLPFRSWANQLKQEDM